MKPLLLIAGAIVFLIASSGCQSEPRDSATFTQMMADGERIYLLNCQRCHHPEGQGYRHLFPRLAQSPIVNYHDPLPMIQLVTNGRGSMPGFGETLTQGEIATVLTYIRTQWGNSAAPIYPDQIPE